MASLTARLAATLTICFIAAVRCQFDEPVVTACRQKEADVVFVTDASSSIYTEDFDRERQCVRDVINRLEISSRYTRAGVVVYSDNPQVAVGLDDYSTKQSLLNAINNRTVRYLTGLTNTADALRTARTQLQFRSNILKVLVVFTDGNSRDQTQTAAEAELAKKDGFYIFVVGIGQYRDEREWREIASDPDETFVTSVEEFRDLDFVAQSLPARLCVLPPILPVRVCEVNQPAELYFVSGTNSANQAVTQIKNIVQNLEASPEEVRLNLFISLCQGAEDLPLQDPTSQCNKPTRPVVNDVAEQIRRLRTVAESKRRDRTANHVAVIFLDNASLAADASGIYTEAGMAKRTSDLKIYVIDLGVTEYRNYLPAIATSSETLISSRTTNLRLEDAFLEKACVDLNNLPPTGIS